MESNEIITPRLLLRLMSEPFMEACLQDQREQAHQLLGMQVLEEWFEQKHLMELRLRQCREDIRYREWCVRAISLHEQNEMIGYIGFHTLPGAPHLANYAPGGVELGYTIAKGHRRLGYATEALRGMIRWASQTQGITRFALSIAPANLPSQGLAKKLRFTKVGEQVDHIDGLEEVFVLEGAPLQEELALGHRRE